ncbi:bacterio-opsin activator domain-containing protein [Halopelagius longus]|uniref:PAS domain S-box protein n=1 Tax=Halopelagius longus TaxID=1236180 RepID=A0A1H0XY87_9EURY|nr:bacterio-opsin activator domain-containing protein [Halopelagius longus]RDI72170.1 PAS domain S-box protein [Halopelagius longus]SDQ07872.1 PAS domain S-box-containing protein [Halopelagius longus]
MTDRNTVLVVGDPPALFGAAFDAVLGDPTLWRASAAEAASRVGDGDEERVDCVVGAVPPEARATLVSDVRERAPGLPVILVVDPDEAEGGHEAFAAGATDYLAARGTDAEAEWLAHRVRAAVDAHRSDRERTRRIAQQYVVSDLGAFALSGPTYERLIEETVERLRAALDVAYIAVGRFRPSVGDVELVAVEGWPQSYVGGVSLGPGTHAERTLWADGALVSERVFLDERFDSSALEDSANIQSGLSVAIEGRDGPWGVITAHSATPGMFDETDGRFIENVATLVGAAIERQTLRSTLEEVFERIEEGVYGLDEQWRITSANPNAARLLGATPEDVVGRSVWTLFEDDYVRAQYERARYKREPATFEAVHAPTGAWYEHRVYPSRNGVSVYLTDVTERRERELELLRYEWMVETADDGVYALDDELRFVEVNRGFADLFGRSREELLGTAATDVIDEETAERIDELRRQSVDTGEAATVEFPLDRPDGSSVWIETRFSALFETDNDGERRFVGTVGISRDVSARRRRERLLTTLQEHTRSLTRVTDYDAAVELTLEACEDLFEPLSVDFFEYDPGERTLRPHPASDADPDELVVPGGNPCWRAFAEEKTVIVDSGTGRGRNLVAEAVGQYGVLSVEMDRDTVADESGTEVFRLLASTMSEILSVVEAEAALGDRDRRLESQNERLTKLNRINRTIREVTGAVVRAATGEEAAARACERLADARPYRFAWFCEVDAATGSPTPTTTSGVEDGYAHRLVEVLSTDPFPELVANTAESLVPAVVKNVVDAPGWEAHRRDALSYGFQSLAVVPAGEGRLLVVHGTDADAFDEEDGEMLAELGATLGSVIDRLGRSQAMLADRRTEVELAVTDERQSLLALARRTGESVRVTGVIPTSDGGYRTFVRTAADREAVEAALPAGTSLTELTDGDDDDHLYEMQLPDRASFEVLYAGGGRLREMTATEAACRVVVTLPESVNVRSVVDAFSAIHPETTLVSKRTVTNPIETEGAFRARLEDEWTERQKEAITAAHHGGFYEWPRLTTATTLADVFDISSPTFQYHLRAAERKLVRTAME